VNKAMNNIFVSKWRVNKGSDRVTFGERALKLCRQAKSESGVSDARFFWCDANTIGFLIEASPGHWGPGSSPSGSTNKAIFDLANISQVISDETWMSAKQGQNNYDSAQ